MEPFVLDGCIADWPAAKWTPETLAQAIATRDGDDDGDGGRPQLTARFGPMKHRKGEILFENDSPRVALKDLHEFLAWTRGETHLTCASPSSSQSGDGDKLHRATHWGYVDYKYMFETLPKSRMADVDWRSVGIDADGADSTLWIGTVGAYTPCHFDTYGFNVHAQLRGAKRWILFPPGDDLRPTRMPYEETSVFSRLDVIGGVDSLSGLNARMIVLRPGQVLFVPPHWWHSVQCVSAGIDDCERGEDGMQDELSISVNTWVPVPALDRVMRAREAVANTIVALLSRAKLLDARSLCPSETPSSSLNLDDSLMQLDAVLRACARETADEGEGGEGEATSRGRSGNGGSDQRRGNAETHRSPRPREQDEDTLDEFMYRNGDQGVIVPPIAFRDLRAILNRGPLTMLDDVGQPPAGKTARRGLMRGEERRLVDCLTHPGVVAAITDVLKTYKGDEEAR